MLDSVKIARRQSEIRQALAGLVGKEKPTEDETRSMGELDLEYRNNETRYRAALIAEDQERTKAKGELETRSSTQWNELVGKFELRQVALALDEGRALDGATHEVVTELRAKGGYRGIPVPWGALEIRTGETVAAGTPSPKVVAPIIDRLFAASAAARMGAAMINVDSGNYEVPVTTSAVAAGWAATETGSVPGPSVYATVDRPLTPARTLGVHMRITRKALKQNGDALEAAVKRDMQGAISEAMDRATFQGSGSAGEPTGILAGAAGWGITVTAVGAAATWAAFRAALVRFLGNNSANALADVNLLCRPEVFDKMDGSLLTNTAVSEWDRLAARIKNIAMSSNALPAPTGTPAASKAILTTSAGGVPPVYIGAWGAVDVIRDPFSDAASGGLRLTALASLDVTISRAVQLEVITGLQ
jgi:HK97 family phage major capsid protein